MSAVRSTTKSMLDPDIISERQLTVTSTTCSLVSWRTLRQCFVTRWTRSSSAWLSMDCAARTTSTTSTPVVHCSAAAVYAARRLMARVSSTASQSHSRVVTIGSAATVAAVLLVTATSSASNALTAKHHLLRFVVDSLYTTCCTTNCRPTTNPQHLDMLYDFFWNKSVTNRSSGVGL